MTNTLFKLRTCSIHKWVFANLAEKNLTPSETAIRGTGFNHITQSPRFYSRNASKFYQKSSNLVKGKKHLMQQAQDALIEYLHATRNLQYLDAENISRNSPIFLEKLLKSVENKTDVKQALRRFFCYHPINEFEPFFESMGMKPCEYSSLLPRDMMFLADDQKLLSNYHVLCAYGISPNKIGRIYIHAREVFRYDHGVLLSQLNSFLAKGFTQSSVEKLVTSCPGVLANEDFEKVVEGLMDLGIVNRWFEEHILEGNSYNWSKILETLCLIKGFGCSKEDVKELLCNSPMVLMEDSGTTTISLIVFLIKFGASIDDILSNFKQLPQIKIQNFHSNLKNCYRFLLEIEMDDEDIANIIRTHWHILGSCMLKTLGTILDGLKSGKKRLCDVIKENPLVLKKLVLGKKLIALPKSNLLQEKIRFLLNLGFVENSKEMSKALKQFRGSRAELQERFDCLVNAGLTHETVTEMVIASPQIMNQSKEVIEKKIDFLVTDLGYDLSSLVKFPAFLSFAIQKVKRRFAMLYWLMDRGKVKTDLALSTVVACSDRMFVKTYVHRDPEGLIVWDNFKKEFFPNENDV